MIVFPGFLNIMYFWIIDNFLKNNANNNEINNNFENYRTSELNVGLNNNTIEDSLLAAGSITSDRMSTTNANDENDKSNSIEMQEPSWLGGTSARNNNNNNSSSSTETAQASERLKENIVEI